VMDAIEIRRVTEEEWPAVLDIAGVTFGEEYTEEDKTAFKLCFPFDRSLGAFDQGRLVATTAVLPLRLTVPGGGSVPMGGLSWVGTLPTHRRQGIFRMLMQGQFSAMREYGEIVSGLGASEGAIYTRYGYGCATSAVSFEVERAHSEFAHEGGRAPAEDTTPARSGRLTLLGAQEAATELPSLYERLRAAQPGTTDRPDWFWRARLVDSAHDRGEASRLYHVKHENGAGVADGYASYRLRENWANETPMLELKVVELLAADLPAYRALWRYLLDTDLTRTTSCSRGRADEPLRWLLAEPRRFHVSALYDCLWLRLLDPRRALAARTYRCAGRLVLQIADPFPVPSLLNLGLQVDEAYRPGAVCDDTAEAPDLALSMSSLGAVYLGGTTFAGLAAAGHVRELRAGAVDEADAMFSATIAPFCCTDF
jgi:predicted acetyltransferase